MHALRDTPAFVPEPKRRGCVECLPDCCLEKAAATGFGAALFVGDTGFFGKCGFVLARGSGIRCRGLLGGEGWRDSAFCVSA